MIEVEILLAYFKSRGVGLEGVKITPEVFAELESMTEDEMEKLFKEAMDG